MATTRNRMATMLFLVFVAGVTAAALWAPGASAEDFTFKVPVQLSNMDPSVHAFVTCGVTNGAGTGFQPVGHLVPVPLDPATGSFSGTITCAFSIPQPDKAFPSSEAAKTYRIWLWLRDKLGNDLDQAKVLKAGTPFKNIVDGNMP